MSRGSESRHQTRAQPRPCILVLSHPNTSTNCD